MNILKHHSQDSEVVDETIKFLTRMYQQLGELIVENVDPRATEYIIQFAVW
jgi:hypothetical protein